MNITATSEKTAQALYTNKVPNGSYWWAIRCVGWISQNKSNLTTTLYTKWQIGSYNYWPYWNDSHQYKVSIGGSTVIDNFNLPQDRSNSWVDKSSAKSITVHHNGDGSYSGTIRFQGYKCWEGFDHSEAITFPAIAIPEPTPDDPEPTPTPVEEDEGVNVVNDLDPKYYILADGEVLYSLTDENYYVVNPKLTLEVNQTDSLEFALPPNHALYSNLIKLKSTIEVKQGKEILFRGRVLDDDIDFYNRKSVHCEGALSFLGDTLMAPYSAGTYSTAKDFFKAAMDQHAEQVPSSTPQRKLKYVKCDVTASIEVENEEYTQSSEVISTLLSDVGGYLKLEYYDDGTTGLSYLSSYNRTSSQVIDFGENLLDLTRHIDAAELYTSVVCLGARDENTGKRLTTGSGSAMYVEDADSIATYGRIIRVFTYDEVTSQSDLRTLATYQLALGIQQAITIEIKAVDLHLIYPDVEKIRIGDSVRVRSLPHNIDSYFMCSRIEIDLQSPENTVYTFGATMKALTDTTSKK